MVIVAMVSSFTSFTPLGVNFGMCLMLSTSWSDFPFRYSIIFQRVPMISCSPLLMVYLNLMLFLGSLAGCLYLLILHVVVAETALFSSVPIP